MKKTLSLFLSLVMAVTCLSFSTAVFADEKADRAAALAVTEKDLPSAALNSYVDAQLKGAEAYLTADSELSFTVESSGDLLLYIRSGADMSKYKEAFVQNVKKNLEENSGKLIAKETSLQYDPAEGDYVTVTNNVENIRYYATVGLCLKAFGYNPASFEGCNFIEAIEKADLETMRPHQYYYKYAIELVSPAYAKVLIADLIKNYYDMGKGMENWGYSCDNTCHFLITIAPFASDFKVYADDAKAVIKTFLKEKGSFGDPEWTPDANSNATALSMASFASVGDVDEALNYYKLLVNNYETDKAGVFLYNYEKADEPAPTTARATKDCLLSLYYFKALVTSIEAPKPETPAQPTSPVTADESVAKVKNVKAVAKKKTVTVKWSKVAGASGYQVKYAANKKFKKAKTVNGKKNKKQLKKLASKKTYYVKVRAYKTVNGNKVYGKWSKAKAVKIK